MTPAERALRLRMARKAASLEPRLRARLAGAYKLVSGTLPQSELVAAINAGLVDRLVDTLMSDRKLDPAFSVLRTMLDRSLISAAEEWQVSLPARFRPEVFDVLNPRILEGVSDLNTRVITGLKDEVRETVRETARAGLEKGSTSTKIARDIREALPLAPNQERAILNFERMLREGDREALNRSLRDKRFDKALLKGNLSEEQITKMTDAYRKRMVAHNAKTQARSIALDSQRAGQRLSWEDAIAQGLAERSALRKRWVTVGDSKVREEHAAMNGEEVGFDERYSNGDLIPGESDYNCRCIEHVFVA